MEPEGDISLFRFGNCSAKQLQTRLLTLRHKMEGVENNDFGNNQKGEHNTGRKRTGMRTINIENDTKSGGRSFHQTRVVRAIII